ncbi:protein max [Galendromus occidentalis]|uniref:Protein max n=1 Tax=Galendromus occidentalis TaxID=34638 RepID=A0AAJ6VUT2_9ACAR|nr:protein max [Galendromus occidentalis]
MSEDESFGSDDDIMSPGSSAARTTFANEDEKRAHHNALERKRRDHIKHSFNSLRDAVPNLEPDGSKVSRAEILKRAAEYIKSMRKRNSAHQQDIHELQKQNQNLEKQIESIQVLQNSHSGGNAANMANYDGSNSDDETDSGTSGDEDRHRKRIKTC